MDVVDVERALTVLMAERLGLVVDKTVFRGAIPSGNKSAVAVICHGDISGNETGMRRYKCQVLAKYADRDDTARLLDVLNRMLPCWGVKSGNITFRALLKHDGSGCYTAADGGKIKEFMSFNFVAYVAY